MADLPVNHFLSYKDSGVDIQSGEHAVELIKDLAKSTYSSDVMSQLGGFGGMYKVPLDRYKSPVLVSTTDGVGTKAYVASMAKRFDTIGIDLVAMCVDDLVCCGATPAYMLDYVSISKLNPLMIKDVVSGIVKGCNEAACSLIGGEMAEHPRSDDVFEFDLAGFAVGIVDQDKILDKSMVGSDNILIGLPSYNLRSNGFSLARKIVFEVAGLKLEDRPLGLDSPTVADLLLEPSVIYARKISLLLESHFDAVTAIAHITGGGMMNNLQRVLPEHFKPVIDTGSWEKPPIFDMLQKLGNVDETEMDLVFNNGIGMILVVKNSFVNSVTNFLESVGQVSYIIGELKKI